MAHVEVTLIEDKRLWSTTETDSRVDYCVVIGCRSDHFKGTHVNYKVIDVAVFPFQWLPQSVSCVLGAWLRKEPSH